MPPYKKRFCSPSNRQAPAALGAALITALLWGAAGARAQAPPPADQIRSQLIANFLQDQKALQTYVHREHVTTEKDGVREGHTIRVWYVHGHEVSETLAFDQRPLTPQEKASGHAAAMQRAAEAAHKPPVSAGTLEFSGHAYPFAKLADDFVYGAATVRQWDGRTVWVYPATPNPNAESRSREEKLLLHTAGEIWVDAQDLHVVRIALHLTSPAKYGFGVLATVHSAALDLILDRHVPGEWLPKEADFDVHATVLMFDSISRGKQTSYFDYQADAPANGAETAP